MPPRILAIALLAWPTIAAFGQEAKQEPAVQDQLLRFHLTFAPDITSSKPFSGRVFVIASRQPIQDLPPRIRWFNPDPFFAMDVKNWAAGQALPFGTDVLGFPAPIQTGSISDGPNRADPTKLAKKVHLPPGEYFVQAVMDLDLGGANCLASPGNGFSKPLFLTVPLPRDDAIALHIDRIFPERLFPEKERVKLVDIESKLLSSFHGKPIRLQAGVVLPKSFADDPRRTYPIIYEIPGFGGDHFAAFMAEKRNATDVAGVDMIHVMLDPSCRTGHHVFADSANNGPFGRALVEELIPHIEARFRGLGKPAGRFLTGHSSGGWSSLWLQTTYPDFFGGTWSTAPDPVDFRDFQKINLYAPGTNIFVDDKGAKRPLARKADKVLLYYQHLSEVEEVMGHGGQLASFEAVFSPRGPDYKPSKLWDRRTGKIDADVARSWEKYDIRLILERNWKTLAPKLAGKIHVYMGAVDSFYLEGATILLQKSLKDLGSNAVVEVFPGRDHNNLVDATLRSRIAEEMAAAFRKGQ